MPTADDDLARGLRVLAADEDERALERTAEALAGLGHRVTSLTVDVSRAAEHVASDEPDVAIVVVHRDDRHALDLITELAAYASGPVIAALDEEDPEFVREAADRGISAYAPAHTPEALQSALELALRRHAEAARLSEQVDQLESALDRRGLIERAKGILMERHGADERAAFELLRSHARARSRTVVDTARAVVDGHALLPGGAGGAAAGEQAG